MSDPSTLVIFCTDQLLVENDVELRPNSDDLPLEHEDLPFTVYRLSMHQSISQQDANAQT